MLPCASSRDVTRSEPSLTGGEPGRTLCRLESVCFINAQSVKVTLCDLTSCSMNIEECEQPHESSLEQRSSVRVEILITQNEKKTDEEEQQRGREMGQTMGIGGGGGGDE